LYPLIPKSILDSEDLEAADTASRFHFILAKRRDFLAYPFPANSRWVLN